MDATTYSAKQLARRREGALRQLLYRYQTEYVELLQELGSRCASWKWRSSGWELTPAQRTALEAKYADYLKGRVEVLNVEKEELLEVGRYGVPVVCEKKVEMKGAPLTFTQAEVYLAEQVTQDTNAALVEPHLLPAAPVQCTSDEGCSQEPPEKLAEEKSAEMQRLEGFACSAGYRSMDREDDMIRLIGRRGKYAICRNTFNIGCTASAAEAEASDIQPDTVSHNSRKRKAEADPETEESLKSVDVDLAKEGDKSDQTQVYAHVWLKADGRFCIKNVRHGNIYIDGNQVPSGEIAILEHWSLVEIDKIAFMVLINRHAKHRLRKRSRYEINI